MVRWCWVNSQCRGVLLIWIRVGQGPIALAVGAGGELFGRFYSRLSFLSPSLWETARYNLKYCLKGPLSPKTTNQPTNQPTHDSNIVATNDYQTQRYNLNFARNIKQPDTVTVRAIHVTVILVHNFNNVQISDQKNYIRCIMIIDIHSTLKSQEAV